MSAGAAFNLSIQNESDLNMSWDALLTNFKHPVNVFEDVNHHLCMLL